MLIIIGLLLLLGLTVATAFFVAQEFAYVAVDRGRLRLLAEQGDRAAIRALRVTGRLSFMLSGAQLGITVTGLLAGYVAEPYLGRGTADLLGAAGIPPAVSLSLAVGVALLVATAIQMVLGELAPKNLAIAKPESLARRLARPTLIYLAATGWLIRVFDAASNWLLRRVGIEPIEELPQGATPEDLDGIIARSRAEGLLDDDTYHLLDRGLAFRTLIAEEVMVPRVDVITIHADEPAARVVDLLDTGHTRFPVIGASVDDVVGIVAVASVVDLEPAARRTTPVGTLATPPVLVTTMSAIPSVLERLRCERQQLACVIDEFGGLAGVITLEDIAEELVGDIRDEDDLPQPTIAAQPDGSWLVPGRWRLDEIEDATGVRLPEDHDYDTVSGLVMAMLGRIPTVGDQVVVDLPKEINELEATRTPDKPRQASLLVERVARHVPVTIRLSVAGSAEPVGSAAFRVPGDSRERREAAAPQPTDRVEASS